MKRAISRRRFLAWSAFLGSGFLGGMRRSSVSKSNVGKNVVISTWNHGLAANEAAYEALRSGKNALDAVELGVKVTEADPDVTSVGYGGLPDATGRVTLDASIMDSHGNAGAVGFLENIKHPISVARTVMEETEHVMLVGKGALDFAKNHGFKEENLLTDEARKAYLRWKANHGDGENGHTLGEQENHDTIGMIAMDEGGNLAGACTTSGQKYKIRGRLGDSPIVGAGVFVDNAVGGAVATGFGEAIIKVAGSFLVVENMRHGAAPADAIEEALKRIIEANHDNPNLQVAFVALNKAGDFGAMSIRKGFQYALYRNGVNELFDAEYLLP